MDEYFNSKSESRTSILDVSIYRECCLKASQDENIFDHFKQCRDIEINIESVKPEMGEKYLSLIRSKYPFLMQYLPEFAKNDKFGNPKLAYFPEIGYISPTTLRYIKVLGEIISLFGSLEGWEVAEIGGGYGGQCRILSSIAKLKAYTIVDLFETLSLAKKYLDRYGLENISYQTIDQLPEDKTYDLAISNYAFTECQKPIQKIYAEKILKRAKRGYMICNFTSHFYNVSSYTMQELVDLLKSYDLPIQILEENPYCGGAPDLEKNVLITWEK